MRSRPSGRNGYDKTKGFSFNVMRAAWTAILFYGKYFQTTSKKYVEYKYLYPLYDKTRELRL